MTPTQFSMVNGTVAAILLFALFVFVRARMKSPHPHHLLDGTVRFMLFFAGAVLLTTRSLYDAIERLVNVNNLAWLLSYLLLITALYILVCLCFSAVPNSSIPRWPKRLWITTGIGLSTVFVTTIAHTPVYYDHALARSVPDFLFMNGLFGYASLMGMIPALVFYRIGRAEPEWDMRLRSLAISFAAGSGAACMLLKLLYTIIGFINPSATGLSTLWFMMWIFFVLSGVGLLILCLPKFVFGRLTAAAEWLHALWVLQDIIPLRQQLMEVCPPMIPEHFTWQHALADPHYQLYRTMVYIFDCQRLLPQYSSHPQVKHLTHSLQALPRQSDSIDDHLASARQISRKVHHRISVKEGSSLLVMLATWLSRIVHPFTVVVPTLMMAAWLQGTPLSSALLWSLLSIPIAILPLALYIAFHVRSGHFEDWNVSAREQRAPLFAGGIAGIALLWTLYSSFDAPNVLRLCLMAAIMAYGIGAVINERFTKISLHATAAAGAAAVVGYLAPALIPILVLLVVAGGWSRIYLGRHTAPQVLLGWLIAFISVAPLFYWLL